MRWASSKTDALSRGARSAPVQVAQAAGGAASDASPLDKIPLPAIQAMIQSPQYKPLGEALLKRFIANQDQEVVNGRSWRIWKNTTFRRTRPARC